MFEMLWINLITRIESLKLPAKQKYSYANGNIKYSEIEPLQITTLSSPPKFQRFQNIHMNKFKCIYTKK